MERPGVVYQEKYLRDIANDIIKFNNLVNTAENTYKELEKALKEAKQLKEKIPEDIIYLESLKDILIKTIENIPASDLETMSGFISTILYDLRKIAETIKGECSKEFVKAYDAFYGYIEAPVEEKRKRLLKAVNVCLTQLTTIASDSLVKYDELLSKLKTE